MFAAVGPAVVTVPGRRSRARRPPRPVLKSIAMQSCPASLPFDSTLRARTEDRLASFDARRVEGRRRDAAGGGSVRDRRRRSRRSLFRIDAAGLGVAAPQRAMGDSGRPLGRRGVAGGHRRRELREEVGLDVPAHDVLGRLDDYATRSGYVITPVVCWGPPRPVLDLDRTGGRPGPPGAARPAPRSGLAATTAIPESDRPVLSVGLLGGRIFAPTAAVIYQAREWLLMNRATRVAHFDQPVFAWK